MLTVTRLTKRVSVVVLVFAVVASAVGTKAHADVPCALVSMASQQGKPVRHGQYGVPDLGGWWTPVESTYRTPPNFEGVRFAGVNGELRGRIGFAVTAQGVSIVNGRGIVRYLDIGEDPLMAPESQ